jgi:coenzyme F420-dependent glucose-6-phosphate dehydrogenase
VKFGYKASAEQFGPRELLDFAVQADAVGFDSVMVSDHYQPWRHIGGHAPFSLSWLAAVGERTSRVVLGTSVLTPTFRYHPAVIAQAFATLGELYPDRIILGIGTGEALNEVSSTGVEWPPFKERLGRLREAVELIRLLWTEERVSFDGDYFHTSNATVYDRPETPVPIYIAGGGPVVSRFAGSAGDGFICTSGKGMDLYQESLVPALEEGLAASGRTEADIDRMIEIKVSFDTDLDLAMQETRFWAPLSLTQEQKAGLDDPDEMVRLADQLPIEQVAKRWIVATDPEAVLAALSPYLEAGFTHLVFHAPGPDQSRFLTLFSDAVLPLLRASTGS